MSNTASARVVTLIANPAGPGIPAEVARAVAREMNSADADWLAPGIACDIDLPASLTQDKAAAALARILDNLPIDAAIQPLAKRRKRALIADMDSTMIDQECIDELAAEVGLKDKVAAITARAMNGEIAFEPALRERVALLADLAESIVDKVIKERITLAAGGKTLLATMRNDSAYTVLVSGGFTAFAGPLADMLGFDEHHANILEAQDGMLTGKVREPILGRQAKVDTLMTVSADRNIPAEDFIAVGDGANDLDMLAAAGTGVALHAKPSVASQADIRIDHGDLTALLYLQGYRQSEFVKP